MWQMKLEVINEVILILMCYHLVLFNLTTLDSNLIKQLDLSLRVHIFTLIGLNTLVIMFNFVMKTIKKVKLRKMKKQAQAEMERRKMEGDQMKLSHSEQRHDESEQTSTVNELGKSLRKIQMSLKEFEMDKKENELEEDSEAE